MQLSLKKANLNQAHSLQTCLFLVYVDKFAIFMSFELPFTTFLFANEPHFIVVPMPNIWVYPLSSILSGRLRVLFDSLSYCAGCTVLQFFNFIH